MRGSACATSNLLLDTLEAEIKPGFKLRSKMVELRRGMVLCNAGDRLRHAYFPVGCVLATLMTLSDGSSLEVNIVGDEGAYGIIAGIGSGEAGGRVDVLVGGRAVCVPMRCVRDEFEGSERVRVMIVRHFENLMFQMQQSAVCAARHPVEARLSRWLLAIEDRAPGQALNLTHEFMASHIGANRTSVTLAARALQRQGLIEYRRGLLTIVDRTGLDGAACECYGAIKSRLARLYG